MSYIKSILTDVDYYLFELDMGTMMETIEYGEDELNELYAKFLGDEVEL